MNYERMTERRETPLTMSMWTGDGESLKVYNRLAELEDKIERGELIERTSEEYSAVCKEAVEEFADEFKRRYFFMMTTYMKDPIYQCTGDELDRLVKEVLEK